jgi:hypothetical protein
VERGLVTTSWGACRICARNALLVVLSVALSVGAIEGFLRWRPEFQAAVPFGRRVVCDGPPGRMERHELFGWTEVPNSAYFEQMSEADGWAVRHRRLRHEKFLVGLRSHVINNPASARDTDLLPGE